MQLNAYRIAITIITYLARFYLQIISFLKNYINYNCLTSVQVRLIDWIEIQEENMVDNMASSISLFKFRPFELQKVNYRRSPEGSFPKQRSGHRIVSANNCLFLFGGFNPNNTVEDPLSCLFRELWKFDCMEAKWSKVLGDEDSNIPAELASHCMIRHGDCLMIYGGTSYPFGLSMSNKLYIYRLNDSRKLMELVETTGEFPPELYGQSIYVHQHYLYVIGGTDGFGYTSDVHRLDLRTKIWDHVYMCRHDIRDDPEPRYRHELACDGNYLYLIGGGTADTAFSMQRIPAYDLERNVWCYFDTKPDPKITNGYPHNRKCHSCVQFENFIVIVGGNDGRRSFKDIWRLDLKTYQWTCFTNSSSLLTAPLFFHDATITEEGLMYIFGGIRVKSAAIRTNHVHQMWVTIPKLSVMSWEAMLHHFPNMQNIDKDKLAELGIPRSFLTRIEAA